MTIEKSSAKHDPEFRYSHDWLSGADVKIGEREYPDAEARYAMDLLRTNGVLMGTADGEDSHGRAKYAVMPAPDLVNRAFEIANLTFAEARRRGCMLLLPDDATIRAKVEENRAIYDREKDERDAAKRKARENANV